MTLEVCGLFVHPIKSAGALAVSEARLEARGLEGDRRWLVVQPDGTFLTQRQEARMALIRPRLDGDKLFVQAPGFEEVAVAVGGEERLRSTVWGSEVEALCATPEADRWIESFLGRPARFVHMDEVAERRVQADGQGPAREVSFADELPVLVATEASLADLNGRLDEPVSMERFRPNIVVRGAEAFDEDVWRRLGCEGWELDMVKPASRCVVVTIDQRTAEQHPAKEPLATLAAFRRTTRGGRSNKAGRVYFGVRAAPLRTGLVRVGDELEPFG